MAISLEKRLAQANGRLKAANIGVRIELEGSRLCFRATFPPRPNSRKAAPHQQRLYPGIFTNRVGVQFAEEEARIIGSLLSRGCFS